MSENVENQLDEWVVRAAAGDRDSLDSLLLHFHDRLHWFIAATIVLSGTAGISHEDILHKAMIAAIRGIRAIEPRGANAFFAWNTVPV